ncbi:MAG: hypothetical protein LBO09_06625 [Candidatus Peribacteria bacterium]|nr:hypothetical protein [Candidatus Peribacteria bacterium]
MLIVAIVLLSLRDLILVAIAGLVSVWVAVLVGVVLCLIMFLSLWKIEKSVYGYCDWYTKKVRNELKESRKVSNFTYNGFSGEILEGFAPYEVIGLVEWTNDPGIGNFFCSDGENHLIPTFALSKNFLKSCPKAPSLRPLEGNGDLFGAPSHS